MKGTAKYPRLAIFDIIFSFDKYLRSFCFYKRRADKQKKELIFILITCSFIKDKKERVLLHCQKTTAYVKKIHIYAILIWVGHSPPVIEHVIPIFWAGKSHMSS
jgi:hypothetical protein